MSNYKAITNQIYDFSLSLWNSFNSLTTTKQVLVVSGALTTGCTVLMISVTLHWRMQEKSREFNGYTTAEQALGNMNLNGKTAIVTGSNSGIGKETVRVLLKQGCTVIMACRSDSKAKTAMNDILRNLKLSQDYNKLSFMKLDLSSLASVESFANEFNSKGIKLNYLINNAGIMALPKYTTSKDGFEMQFATNYLGHFYLTNLLLPSLLKNNSQSNINDNDDEEDLARIINLSSVAEAWGPKYDELNKIFDRNLTELTHLGLLKADYKPYGSYSISKTCSILFARELGNRYKNRLIAVSCHPGVVLTGLQSHMGLTDFYQMMRLSQKNGQGDLKTQWQSIKNIEQGAATTIRCISMKNDEIESGGYYFNCNIGDFRLKGASSQDKDGKLAKKMWHLSAALIESRAFNLTNV